MRLTILILLFAKVMTAQVSIIGGYTFAPNTYPQSAHWSSIEIPEVNILNINTSQEDEIVKKRFSSQIGLQLNADLHYLDAGVEVSTGKYSNLPSFGAYVFGKYKNFALGYKKEIDLSYTSLKAVELYGAKFMLKIGEKPIKGHNDFRKASIELIAWYSKESPNINLRLKYNL